MSPYSPRRSKTSQLPPSRWRPVATWHWCNPARDRARRWCSIPRSPDRSRPWSGSDRLSTLGSRLRTCSHRRGRVDIRGRIYLSRFRAASFPTWNSHDSDDPRLNLGRFHVSLMMVPIPLYSVRSGRFHGNSQLDFRFSLLPRRRN